MTMWKGESKLMDRGGCGMKQMHLVDGDEIHRYSERYEMREWSVL